MARGSAGANVRTQLYNLSQVEVVGNMSDGQLRQRFLLERDGRSRAAFSALVHRHGPMVLRVCQQVLGNCHDTEDAFQATFLVLARKAGSVRDCDSVASWLHGVARRVSMRARAKIVGRDFHERRAAAMKRERSERGDGWSESWPEVHEEITRLPQLYREPVVLCYLEGLTAESASQRIGCARGTILSRLSRARERLRERLTRRGLAPSGIFATAEALPETATALVPASLEAATIQGVMRFATGKTVAGAVPAAVTLAEGVLHTMFLNHLTHVAASLVGTAAIAIGVVVLAGQGPGAITQTARSIEPSSAVARPIPDQSPSPPATAEAIDGEGADEMIEGLLARSTAVTSGCIEYHVKIDIAGQTANDNNERYCFSGESWAMRDPESNHAVLNHEGRLLSYFETPRRSLTINHSESAFHHDPVPPVYAGTLWYASTRRFVRDQASKARVLEAQTVNGIETRGLEWNVARSDTYLAFGAINEMLQDGGRLRLFVARQFGYALPRIEYVDKFGTVQAKFDFSDFKEVAPRIFFPAVGRIGGGSFNRTYQLKKIERINGTMLHSDFVLAIPADTAIGDERPKLKDEVGSDGKRTYSLKDYPFRNFHSGAPYPQGLPAELLKELDRDVVGADKH
jgi:RNA polymerase sigma factor (sigma-70 family)